MRKLTCLSFLLICFSLATAQSENEIFGLPWCSSPAQVKAMGIDLELQQGDKDITIYLCDSLPKNHSMAESYLLAFYKDSCLAKVAMVTKDIDDYPTGSTGKETFDKICKQIHP